MPWYYYAGDTGVSCEITDDESVTIISNDIDVAEFFVKKRGVWGRAISQRVTVESQIHRIMRFLLISSLPSLYSEVSSASEPV